MLTGEKSSQGAAKGFHELLVKFGFKASSEKLKKSTAQKDAPSLEMVQKLGRRAKYKLAHFRSERAKLTRYMQNQMSLDCLERNSAEIEKLYAFQK